MESRAREVKLSPRVRADYLLLYPAPTARTCLEALATPSGIAFCLPYPNIIRRAAEELPELPELLRTLPPELVAHRVCMMLDGVPLMPVDDLPDLTGLMDD